MNHHVRRKRFRGDCKQKTYSASAKLIVDSRFRFFFLNKSFDIFGWLGRFGEDNLLSLHEDIIMYTTLLQLGAPPSVGYGLASRGVEALRPIVIASLLSIFVFKDSWLGKGLWSAYVCT